MRHLCLRVTVSKWYRHECESMWISSCEPQLQHIDEAEKILYPQLEILAKCLLIVVEVNILQKD